MNLNSFELAIELRYPTGYNLLDLAREGIGVYIGNLIRELVCSHDDIKLYLIISPNSVANALKFLDEYASNSNVKLLYDGDGSTIALSNLQKANLYFHAEPRFVESFGDAHEVLRYDLKLDHWMNALIKHSCMSLHFKADIEGDLIFDSTDTKKSFYLSVVRICTSSRPVTVVSQEIILDLNNTSKLSAVLDIESHCVRSDSRLELQIGISCDLQSLTVISNMSIDLSCMNRELTFQLESEQDLDIETRINNSSINAILFHHISTYHSRYRLPCAYHLHDLVFVEHGSKYAQHLSFSNQAKELVQQSREAPVRIKNNSLVIFSSEHVRDKHFRDNFPYKYDNVESIIIRNSFITSEFATSSSNVSDHIKNFCMERQPYITYPTQPRPTKQFNLLEDIVSNLKSRCPDISLVLTCSEAAYRECLGRNPPDYVFFLNGVSRSDLYYIYKMACACIVTTCYEASLPWQFLESLVAGTPAVCYRSQVVEEFIRLGFIDIELANQITFSSAAEALAIVTEVIVGAIAGVSHAHAAHAALLSLKNTLPSTSWNLIATDYILAIKGFSSLYSDD